MAGNTVFYAWQSDTSPECNRYFIRDAIQKALARLKQDETVNDCPRLDSDTSGVPGTPTIADTIFEKIEKTRLFIADVTFIGNSVEKRLPNPNVMIELGYALRAVSANRLILVMNTAFGGTDDLPFDLRNRRFPISYHLEASASKEKRQEVFAQLVTKLHQAIGPVLQVSVTTSSTRNLRVKVNPTRDGRRQMAQIQLFNSGPGPVFVESWLVEWETNGRKRFNSSIITVKGRLPIRLEEQDAADVIVEIGDDLESLVAIGVLDGDRHLWRASNDDLDSFKHNAIAHRLPKSGTTDPGESALPLACDVTITPRLAKTISSPQERLEVVLKHNNDKPLSIQKVQLSWEYTPPRKLPSQPGKASVSESGQSVSLAPELLNSDAPPKEDVVFVLDYSASGCLVELLRGDVRDEDIRIEVITKSGAKWQATMNEVPTVVKSLAQMVLNRLKE